MDRPPEKKTPTKDSGTLAGVCDGYPERIASHSELHLEGLQLLPLAAIKVAAVPEQQLTSPWEVDAAVTRRVRVPSHCTCHSGIAPCPCCRRFHAAAVAREFRMGAGA